MNASRIALVVLSALFWCAAGLAQTPPRTQPVPEPPPAPPEITNGSDAEPQVTVIHREDNLVEEYRVGGELRYVRVTPRTGRPYYLIPDSNGTTYIRRDSLDPTLKVPLWVLFSF